jgi:hypothetical protein
MSVTEQELQSVAVAPRVTKEDVDSAIIGEKFVIDGTLTICILTLYTGTKLTGESACASPENFNEEIGRRLAKEDAMKKVWPLLGFELKKQLHLIQKAGKPSGKIVSLGSPVTYLGTKVIHAIAMTRGDYNKYRGWELPADENGEDNGYLVEDANGGAPNVEGHTGYVSWSPRAVFEKAYCTSIRHTPENFVDRLLQEKDYLTEKTLKLSMMVNDAAGVMGKLTPEEQQELREQLEHMLDYLNVLNRRAMRYAPL